MKKDSKQLAGQDLEISKKHNTIYALDRQISNKKKKLEEIEQNLYVNAQGENFRDMRPIFDEER